jgi:tetratricopeptide (TPR) repeat protein
VSIDALISGGRYAEAAQELRRLGDLVRAQALYEKIWDFKNASEVARERGDRPDLLRLLLSAKDFVEARKLGDQLLDPERAAPGEQARAVAVYEKHRMWAEAAALREALGQLERARELYGKAQLPLEAARLDETLGHTREAGIAYERFLAAEPDSPEAPRAHLHLGRLLAGFQRHDEAARHLQKAVRNAERSEARIESTVADKARRALVGELAALGYRDAASDVLELLRIDDPALPALDAFLQQERAAQSVTRLAGRYVIDRLIGSGGMGRVYLARDVFSGRDVAVKVVAPPVDARLAEGYQRFVREARAVSALHHPNIVQVLEFHEELGLLAMEYMAGGTLADRLPGALTPGAVRQLVLSLLAGLEAAHAHGVIHRDLKPANVFYSASGEAKLGDFGVAHLQDLGATQTAGFIGTLAYMSPEQITGAPLSFAADVYALGITTFQALTGRLPFTGPDFVAQHLGETPPPPSRLKSALAAWDAPLQRALAKDPRARFASLEEMRQAIAGIPVAIELTPALAPAPVAAAAPEQKAERYILSGEMARSARSTLHSAEDTQLGRAVVIEELDAAYAQSEAGRQHLSWLRAFARHGGPHLQRVLRISDAERSEAGIVRIIYEAVLGPPPSGKLDERARSRLLSALQPLHDIGVAHGAIADSLVVDEGGPTLLVAGRGPTGATVDDDVRALRQFA